MKSGNIYLLPVFIAAALSVAARFMYNKKLWLYFRNSGNIAGNIAMFQAHLTQLLPFGEHSKNDTLKETPKTSSTKMGVEPYFSMIRQERITEIDNAFAAVFKLDMDFVTVTSFHINDIKQHDILLDIINHLWASLKTIH